MFHSSKFVASRHFPLEAVWCWISFSFKKGKKRGKKLGSCCTMRDNGYEEEVWCLEHVGELSFFHISHCPDIRKEGSVVFLSSSGAAFF